MSFFLHKGGASDDNFLSGCNCYYFYELMLPRLSSSTFINLHLESNSIYKNLLLIRYFVGTC